MELVILIIAIPAVVVIGSIVATVKFLYTGAIVSSLIATVIFHFVWAGLSGFGDPQGRVKVIDFLDQWKEVILFGLVYSSVLLILAFAVEYFTSS